jgi:cytochrome b
MANDEERGGRSERGRKRNKTEAEEFWEEIHEVLSNLTLFLVFLHVAGALIASAIHKENFIKAMITGYKTRREP